MAQNYFQGLLEKLKQDPTGQTGQSSLTSGLLGNPDALIGFGLLQGATQGKNVFEAALPAITQAAQIKKLFTPKDARTNLIKNLIAAGLKPGTPEFKEAVLAGTSKTKEGFQTTSPLYSKSKIDDATTSAGYAMEGLNKLTLAAKLTSQSPGVFGVKGKFGQVSKDIVSELKGVTGSSQNFLKKLGVPLSYLDNPDYTTIQPLENSIAIHIARNRNPSGRLLKDMINTAKDDAKLTGLGGVQKVQERLRPLAAEFIDSAYNKLKLSGKNDQEIGAILNPKIAEFNKYFAPATAEPTQKGSIPKFKINLKTGNLERY